MEDCAGSDDDTGVGISPTLQSLSNTATSSTTSTTTADASNAVTLAALVDPILSNEELYTDQTEYTKLLQDHGSASDDGATRCPNKTFEYQNTRYRDIWELANRLKNLYAAKKWSNIPSNATFFRRYIATYIVTHRHPVKSGDVCHLSHSKELVELVHAETDVSKVFYSLDQKSLLRWAYSKWGMEPIAELKKPRINDRLRVIGLCLHEDFRDRVGLLLGQTQNRSQLDDPGHAKDVVYAELAVKFNDRDFKVRHPANWKNAENELSTYSLFDPNDLEVFRVPRDRHDMDKLFKTSLKYYKDAMKKWVKDTGAGSGEEVRFVTWDETKSWKDADDTKFQNFDNFRGEWLTWIYMLDKQFDNVLWSKYGTMRGIGGRGDTGDSGGKGTSTDFNSSAGDATLINLVKANMENGQSAMERIAKVLENAVSNKTNADDVVPGDISDVSGSTSVVTTRLAPTPIRPLETIVNEKMIAINNLKRAKEDAETNEQDESMKRLKIDIANTTMLTLWQEIKSATHEANGTE